MTSDFLLQQAHSRLLEALEEWVEAEEDARGAVEWEDPQNPDDVEDMRESYEEAGECATRLTSAWKQFRDQKVNAEIAAAAASLLKSCIAG
jgi:hypothetical protein